MIVLLTQQQRQAKTSLIQQTDVACRKDHDQDLTLTKGQLRTPYQQLNKMRENHPRCVGVQCPTQRMSYVEANTYVIIRQESRRLKRQPYYYDSKGQTQNTVQKPTKGNKVLDLERRPSITYKGRNGRKPAEIAIRHLQNQPQKMPIQPLRLHQQSQQINSDFNHHTYNNIVSKKRYKSMEVQSQPKGGQALLSGISKDSDSVVEFPLKKIDYQINICDGLAQINQKHIYRNTSEQFMELQFQLPINPETCLHKFVASFAGKIIEGVIKEKDEAREEYAEAVAEGKMAAIGQINKDRNIMNIQIGNIPPKSDVFLQFSCIQELKITLNTFYCFDLKTRMSPKCFDNLSRQSLIKSFRKARITMIGQFQWDFRLQLRSTRKIITARSTTHSLKLENQNDANTMLSFTLDKDSLDHDFSFIYTTQEFQLPSFSVGRNDSNTTVMVSFIPKFCHLSLADAEKAAMEKSSKLTMDIQNAKGQYIFLLDRSGSMQGTRICNAKKALIIFLKSLPVDSYFNVVSFGSHSQSLFDKSQPSNNQSTKHAIERINQMSADFGGTNIYQPLEKIFESPVIEGYPKQVFLLTDGQVDNVDQIGELVRRKAKYSRVHGIGIGSGVSKNLIIECSKKGKGSHTFIDHHENPTLKIVNLLKDSLSAVVSQVELQFDERLVQSIVPNPKSIPYVLKGEIINFFITFKNHLAQPTRVTLSYRDSMNNLPYKASSFIDPQAQSFAFIDKMGHFKTIKALEDSFSEKAKLEDRLYYAKQIDKKKQIVDLSIKSQVLSTFTSFLCVEKNIVDGRHAQISAKGKMKLHIQQKPVERTNLQPNIMPRYSYPAVGVGKGGKGVGGKGKVGTQRTAMKRHARASLEGITKGVIRRLARKGGVKRLSSFVYDDARVALIDFLRPLLCRTITYSECARRKTVTALDVVYALRSLSRSIYGTQSTDQSANKKKLNQASNLFKTKPIHKVRKQTKKAKLQAEKQQMDSFLQKVIQSQNSQGFWSDQSLVSRLLNESGKSKTDQNEQPNLLITMLLTQWLDKNFPSGEYSLLVNKAKNWMKKQPMHSRIQKKYSFIQI